MSKRMEARLSEKERDRYHEYLAERYEGGVIEQSSEQRQQKEFFLPHHGILKGEKLRVVFNGSFRDGRGISLNEYLDPGENLLLRLLHVLLVFRMGAYATQNDICAAFHRIVVTAEDRRYLKFFWKGCELNFFRFPFGLSCSPNALLRTVVEHIRHFEDQIENHFEL